MEEQPDTWWGSSDTVKSSGTNKWTLSWDGLINSDLLSRSRMKGQKQTKEFELISDFNVFNLQPQIYNLALRWVTFGVREDLRIVYQLDNSCAGSELLNTLYTITLSLPVWLWRWVCSRCFYSDSDWFLSDLRSVSSELPWSLRSVETDLRPALSAVFHHAVILLSQLSEFSLNVSCINVRKVRVSSSLHIWCLSLFLLLSTTTTFNNNTSRNRKHVFLS